MPQGVVNRESYDGKMSSYVKEIELLLETDDSSDFGAAGDDIQISGWHEIAIPERQFSEAGFHVGDTVEVRAVGPGRILVTRADSLLARYSGALPPGTYPPGSLEKLRDEWQ